MPPWGTPLWGILWVLYYSLLRGRRKKRKEAEKDGVVSIYVILAEHGHRSSSNMSKTADYTSPKNEWHGPVP